MTFDQVESQRDRSLEQRYTLMGTDILGPTTWRIYLPATGWPRNSYQKMKESIFRFCSLGVSTVGVIEMRVYVECRKSQMMEEFELSTR